MSIDKTYIGAALGLTLPALTSLALWQFAYRGQQEFMDFVWSLASLDSASTLIAVCSLPNLALFILFVNFNKIKFARGVFLTTLLYALLLVIFKFGLQ